MEKEKTVAKKEENEVYCPACGGRARKGMLILIEGAGRTYHCIKCNHSFEGPE